jgi:hypothetical protein
MKLSVTLLLIYVAVLIGCTRETPRASPSNPSESSASQSNSEPVVLAKNEDQPAAIGVDEANVYWIAESRSAIHKISKTGGTVTAILKGQEGIRRMVVDADAVYFLTNTQIKRVSKNGGEATTLVTFADLGTPDIGFWRLAVDKNYVYFVGGPRDDQLLRVSKAGGKPEPVAKVLAPSEFVFDETNIYWADSLSEVKKLSLGGGEPVTIGECEKAEAVAVDSTGVYCASDLGKVIRFAKSDAAMTIVGSVENAPFDQLAVDDRSIYTVGLTSGIYRFDKSGGQPVKLAPVDKQLVKFATDAQNLYWSNYDEGTITRRRK